jgi:hypothetical protein
LLPLKPPSYGAENASPWELSLGYSISTDYADTTTPRSYTNSVLAGVDYHFDANWSLGLEVGVRAETIDGQIPKEVQQSYAETVSPSTAIELDYTEHFWRSHKFLLFLHAEPLWDDASRLEGYQGLYGGGGSLIFNFFGKTYTLAQTIDATELYNTFAYATDTTSNPDYFYTYKLVNALHFWGSYKIAYTFGFKATRYMDDFWGYNYQNSISIGKSWQNFSASLVYTNGGFTDDGTVSLWYIDEYRSIGQLILNYSF